MTIYEVGADYDTYKFFVFENDGELIENTTGQSLQAGWRPRRLTLFNEPTKRKDNRRKDFDASIYFQGLLFVNQRTEQVLQSAVGDQMEFLPVITDGQTGQFSYANLLGSQDAINRGDLNASALMQLIRAKKIPFNLSEVKDKLLFRAQPLGYYFCTPAFLELVEQHQIKGLRFEAMGEAS